MVSITNQTCMGMKQKSYQANKDKTSLLYQHPKNPVHGYVHISCSTFGRDFSQLWKRRTNPNHASLESLTGWTDETMAVRSQRNLHNNTSKVTIPSVAAKPVHKNECGHNLVSATQKVSDRHLQHEYKWPAAMTPTDFISSRWWV